MTLVRDVRRMTGETIIDPPEPVPGSWLRIIGRFTWSPKATFEMERVASGTCYHAETPTKVREILETYGSWNRNNRDSPRLAFHYGDPVTGEDWLDEWDMEGYVSRTTGPLASPLLVANSRSTGGGTILDRCIIRIRFANRSIGGDLYRHPNYHADRDKHRQHITDVADEERVWNRRFA